MSCRSFSKFQYLRTLLLKGNRNSFSNIQCCRNLLSPAYQCTDAWNRRLEGPLFDRLDLDDFFVVMDKKFKAKKKVTALDIDLFVNSITTDDRFGELNHLLYLFRRTRSTVRTLDSTHHAVVRLLLQYGRYELLLKILKDRIGYGIFPDHYAMNLAMDEMIQKENFKDASCVASLLMLQEELDYPVSKILALYACHMHLREEDAKPWHDDTPVPQGDDDDNEEVLVRVPYLRNPYFDDHFDLTLREHLLGKTLYYVTRDMNDVVGRSYGAVGLALYEKWPHLLKLLEEFRKAKEPVLKESVVHIKSILSSKGSDEKTNTEQGHTDDKSETSSGSAEDSQDVIQNKISDCLKSMEKTGLIVDGDLHELVCAKIKTLPEIEGNDIKAMTSLYQEWEENRNHELKREMTAVSLKEAELAVNTKKKELKDREQLLTYFENEDKHMMALADIEEEAAKAAAVSVSEVDYVVPELPRKQPIAKVKKAPREVSL